MHFNLPWCCRSEHCVSGSPFLISCLLVLLQKHKFKHLHESAHTHTLAPLYVCAQGVYVRVGV